MPCSTLTEPQYRGIVQYYLLAGDVWRLNRLEWAAKTSMLKTLAAKHRSRVTLMARKLGSRGPAGETELLRGRHRAAGQEATDRQVRRHPAETAEEGGHRRPPGSPGNHPQGTGHPAPRGPVRVVPAARGRGSPPGPQARRPHPAGTPAARVGATHGQDAQEDAHRLHPLPPGHPRGHAHRCHGIATGEPRAPKGARVVRTGGRRKRTCRTAGTSPPGLPGVALLRQHPTPGI